MKRVLATFFLMVVLISNGCAKVDFDHPIRVIPGTIVTDYTWYLKELIIPLEDMNYTYDFLICKDEAD